MNIAELLKDCPKGMELDCTMFDNVTFVGVNTQREFPIEIKVGCITKHLTKEGCYHRLDCIPSAKCVIFPKGKTTWKGFQRPFKDGDILAYQFPSFPNPSIYIHKYSQELNTAFYVALSGNGDFKVRTKYSEALYGNDSSARFATEEEKQKLFDAIKDNGYKWNPEIKTLEKLSEFKAGDVLVSSAGNIVLCDYIDNKQIVHYHCILDPFNSFRICNDIGVGKSFHCTLATSAEKQKLFDKIKNAGYKYNSQTNKLEKLIEPKFKVGDRVKHKDSYISGVVTEIDDEYFRVKYNSGAESFTKIKYQDDWELIPNKFDITTLKGFDKVLVRDSNKAKWVISFFSHCNNLETYKYSCLNNTGYAQCIPYEGNEHLIDTTDDCDDYYKTWE